MESELMKLAISQGIWCALFLFLFFWTIRENQKREVTYQATIKENQTIIKGLTDTIKCDVSEIKQDIEEIKVELERK